MSHEANENANVSLLLLIPNNTKQICLFSVPLENLSAAIERIGGAECANDFGDAYASIALLLYNRNVAKLREDFNICFSIQYYNSYDVASFYYGINQVLINHIDINRCDLKLSLIFAFFN